MDGMVAPCAILVTMAVRLPRSSSQVLMADPAMVDRETTYLGPVGPGSLPNRGMHIPGLTGRADGKILSKAAKGATTRLVTFPAGWGTTEPGAFSADVELLLLEGTLAVSGTNMTPHSLLIANGNHRLTSLCSDKGATALLSTSGPIRYQELEDSRGEAVVLLASDQDWISQDDRLVVKSFESSSPIATRLVFAGHVVAGNWKRLHGWSERLVLQGEWREHAAALDGQSMVQTIRPMAYVSRPPGTPFDGPRSGTDATALFIDRVAGVWAPTMG